jgi:hypothetical protein
LSNTSASVSDAGGTGRPRVTPVEVTGGQHDRIETVDEAGVAG